MIVMKFGGTSVGSAKRMKHVASLINDTDKPVIVVLSAMSGTTNQLVKISSCYYKKEKTIALKLIDELEEKYNNEVAELFSTEYWRTATAEFVKEKMQLLRDFADDLFTTFEEKCVLSQGELLSTQMMINLMNEQKKNATLLPALDFMRTDKNGIPDLKQTTHLLNNLLKRNSCNEIFITQGFICKNAFGETDNLQRGGSDYTASLIGAAINADEIQIWTDIDGMHNNDPRIVEGTSPVAQISYEEASELAFFGAKILHPTCVKPAQKFNIPIRLKNTMQPLSPGTIINKHTEANKLKAVAAKDDMWVLRISNTNGLAVSDFLSSVYSVFANYQTTVFTASTAENSISVCIENSENNESILEDLSVVGEVETNKETSIITVVGDMRKDNSLFLNKIISAMSQTPLIMASYGGGNYSFSVVIDEKNKHNAMRELSKMLF